jgi:hypothetical protein
VRLLRCMPEPRADGTESGAIGQVATPGAEGGDLQRVLDRHRLAEETRHLGAVLESDPADAERRRDAGDEGPELVGRHQPDLDRGPAGGDPDQAASVRLRSSCRRYWASKGSTASGARPRMADPSQPGTRTRVTHLAGRFMIRLE